jgi:hypothetical protein
MQTEEEGFVNISLLATDDDVAFESGMENIGPGFGNGRLPRRFTSARTTSTFAP